MSRIHISHRGVSAVGAYSVLMPREAGKPKYTTSIDGQAVDGFILLGNRDHLEAVTTWLKRGRCLSAIEFIEFMRNQIDGKMTLVVLTEPTDPAISDFDFKMFTASGNGRINGWAHTEKNFLEKKSPFEQYIRMSSPGGMPRLTVTAYPITARQMLTFYNEDLASPYAFWSQVTWTRRGPKLQVNFTRNIPKADRARLRHKPKARVTRKVRRFDLIGMSLLSAAGAHA